MTTDEALVARYADPDTARNIREEAFRELVERHHRRLYAVCYRFFGTHADAEDAVQETLLALARKAAQFRGEAQLSTWLYQVATNTCRDLARKRARRPQTATEDMAVLADEADVDDELAGRETAWQLQQALGELDEQSRSLLILTAIEGMSYAEASRIFEMPVGTIKSRVSRARARLAQLLAGEETTDAAATRPRPEAPHPSTADPTAAPRGPPG